jgi:GH15 family glucan-1,4-alpha-glucosidase
MWVGGALARIGHPEILRDVLRWLDRVRAGNRPFLYWFQKYSIDGVPEWETPAIDQTAMIPWSLERYYRATGDADFVAEVWPMVEQAATVCQGDSGGHPGLFFDEDLNLIHSAGMGDQLYGRFLYSNAVVVAGLRSAARLAHALGRDEQATRWAALAARIWDDGIMREVATGREGPPGLIDPETGRFLSARRTSMLRGLWTSDPEFLADRSTGVDVNTLGLASPFGLLPASHHLLMKTAETIIRSNAARVGPGADADVLARMSYPSSARPRGSRGDEPRDVSSLATFWMIRYLIELGRESGQGRHWARAVVMIDALLGRLGPLGLLLRSGGRSQESARLATTPGGIAWSLHAMMVETMLDLVGLEYDAVDRRISIRPILPGSWPHTGASRPFPCGDVAYRLERPLGGTLHRLTFEATLSKPVTLDVSITCPGLAELGPWRSSLDPTPPEFDPRTSRVRWSARLKAGEHKVSWSWG